MGKKGIKVMCASHHENPENALPANATQFILDGHMLTGDARLGNKDREYWATLRTSPNFLTEVMDKWSVAPVGRATGAAKPDKGWLSKVDAGYGRTTEGTVNEVGGDYIIHDANVTVTVDGNAQGPRSSGSKVMVRPTSDAAWIYYGFHDGGWQDVANKAYAASPSPPLF